MVVPEVPEEFFEEIGPVDLEVEPLELTEPQRLVLGKVPRVLQPDELNRTGFAGGSNS